MVGVLHSCLGLLRPGVAGGFLGGSWSLFGFGVSCTSIVPLDAMLDDVVRGDPASNVFYQPVECHSGFDSSRDFHPGVRPYTTVTGK